MTPKISVVMPCRDRGYLIAESIKSIIDQTYSSWELIIVDDHSGSEDKTEEIVNLFKDDRIFYIKLDDKFGKGIAAARNFGSMLAKGQYIAVADSDDISYPDRLELSVKELDLGVDVVYGDIDVWNPKTGEISPKSERSASRDFSIEDFKLVDFIPHPTAAYKRIWIVDFPYNTFFRIAEDYDFFSRIEKYGAKFRFIKKSLVKYRSHQGSIGKQPGLGFSFEDVIKFNRDWSDDRPELFGR